MKKILIVVLVLVIILGGAYVLMRPSDVVDLPEIREENDTRVKDPRGATSTPDVMSERKGEMPIGTSVQGASILAYHFGTGAKELLFVGGLHGGYSWNTALVAYELIDYLKNTPDALPEGLRVTVIPVANPDGLMKVVGTTGRFDAKDVVASQEVRVSGRFNAHTVDLNRNFDCDWKTTGVWQNKPVSGGEKAFSEPESKALRDYVETYTPDAVVVWYSAAGGVYASRCGTEAISSDTKELLATYAKGSGYPAHESFDFYETSGDMVNWLAKEGIAGISVLLSNHSDTEWAKNKAGIEALFKHYAE